MTLAGVLYHVTLRGDKHKSRMRDCKTCPLALLNRERSALTELEGLDTAGIYPLTSKNSPPILPPSKKEILGNFMVTE
jgi:hypothetical protein